MEIAGNWLVPGDKERLDEWRNVRLDSFARFREGAELADDTFRTDGDLFYLGTNV
jgi:hypothetical protein